jgi:malate dehydrogenase (oxaloacetate-decarboxylating)(NADP+)
MGKAGTNGADRTPRGLDVLRDPVLNRGTAFTEAERDTLGLRGAGGALPDHFSQAERSAGQVRGTERSARPE